MKIYMHVHVLVHLHVHVHILVHIHACACTCYTLKILCFSYSLQDWSVVVKDIVILVTSFTCQCLDLDDSLCPLFFVFCLFVCFGNFTFYRQHANLAGTLSGHGSWVLGVSFCPDNTHFVSRYSPFCIVIKIIHKSSLFNKRKRLSGNCVKLNKIYYKICKDLCVFNWVKEQLFSSVAFQFQWQDSKSLGCRLKAVYSDILWTQWPGNRRIE